MSDLKSQMEIAYLNHTLPYVKAIFAEGETYAVRALYSGEYEASREGVFTTAEGLAAEAVRVSNGSIKQWSKAKGEQTVQPYGVYMIANPVKSSLLARVEPDKMVDLGKGEGVKDTEIAKRVCLFVDVDSVKDGGVAGICATEEERAKASAAADAIVDQLTAAGWPAPIRAVSGNGAQVTYRLDLPNTPEIHQLVKAVTVALHHTFSVKGEVDVDQAVHNAARLWRLPGTWNRKGRNVADRPHRMAELVTVPDGWAASPVTEQQLRDLVATLDVPEATKVLVGKAAPAPKPAKVPMPPKSRTTSSKAAASSSARFTVVDEGCVAPTPAPAPKAPSKRVAAKMEASKVAAAELALTDTSWVADALGCIDVNGPRTQWLGVCRAIKGLMGAEGLGVFMDWSLAYGGDPATDEATWDCAEADAPEDGARALMGMAKQGGWSFKQWREDNGITLDVAARTPAVDAAPPIGYTGGAGRGAVTMRDYWYDNRPTEMYAESILCVANALRNQLRTVASPVRSGDELLVCDPQTNLWAPVEAHTVANLMVRWVEGVALTSTETDKGVKMFEGKIATGKVISEAIGMSADVTKIKANVAQLVLADGVLRPDASGQVNLEPLLPAHYATYGYAVSSQDVRTGSAQRWFDYLNGLFPGAKDPDMHVEYLLRWIALAVFGATIKFQAPALILKGKAGTGKSTLGKIIEMIMPHGSTCSVPPQDWGHEYNRSELVGKLFNFVPELQIDEPIGDLDQVKKIIFGEITSARRIYSQVQTFHPQAAHLFCANGLPNLKKADPAVFKRFVQLEVTGKVVRHTASENTEFAEELVAAELPGILSSLIGAYERAAADRAARTPGTANGLPILAEAQASNDEWRNKSDAVSTWLSEEWEFDPNMSARQSPKLADAYRQFVMWCQCAGLFACSRPTFKLQVQNVYTVAQSCKQDVIVGLGRPMQAVPDVSGFDDDAPF